MHVLFLLPNQSRSESSLIQIDNGSLIWHFPNFQLVLDHIKRCLYISGQPCSRVPFLRKRYTRFLPVRSTRRLINYRFCLQTPARPLSSLRRCLCTLLSPVRSRTFPCFPRCFRG